MRKKYFASFILLNCSSSDFDIKTFFHSCSRFQSTNVNVMTEFFTIRKIKLKSRIDFIYLTRSIIIRIYAFTFLSPIHLSAVFQSTSISIVLIFNFKRLVYSYLHVRCDEILNKIQLEILKFKTK